MDAYSENLTKKDQTFGNSGTLAQEVATGFVYQRGLLPTPKKQNANHPGQHGQGGMDLQTYIQKQLLPTPTVASDVKGGCTRPDPARQEDTLAHAIHGLTGGKPGTTSQLNPLFVADMMGFPENWTVLPFLSGETNQ